jgi:hypothetical protein
VILSKSALRFTNAVFLSGVLVLLGFPQSTASRILDPVASPSNTAPSSRLHLASSYLTAASSTFTLERLSAASGRPQTLTPATYLHP